MDDSLAAFLQDTAPVVHSTFDLPARQLTVVVDLGHSRQMNCFVTAEPHTDIDVACTILHHPGAGAWWRADIATSTTRLCLAMRLTPSLCEALRACSTMLVLDANDCVDDDGAVNLATPRRLELPVPPDSARTLTAVLISTTHRTPSAEPRVQHVSTVAATRSPVHSGMRTTAPPDGG